jgi:hypothetical protein
MIRRSFSVLAAIIAVLAASPSTAFDIQAPTTEGRFDRLVVGDPAGALDVATMSAASLPTAARSGWDSFRAAHGAEWSISLDRRSGAPLLVEGKGIAWPVGAGATIDSIAATLRPFIAANRSLLLADDSELVLDRDASGPLQQDVWQIVFSREVAGVPVAGERYLFTIGHGNLISFGSPRWSRIDVNATPDIDEAAARARLTTYMGLTKDDAGEDFERPRLEFIPLRAGVSRAGSGYYRGAIGSGYSSALVWRFSLRVAGDPGLWLAQIDAHSGAIRSFGDDTKHASRLKGGIYPHADDQICPDGCEQPNYPIPFATINVNGGTPMTTSNGIFNCAPVGSTATTTLTGPYVKIAESCGPISESVICSNDLDLGITPGINCNVQPGASPGNTYAARSSFFHLNRAAEHARFWLPTRIWLAHQFTANVNVPQACLGAWNAGQVYFGWTADPCNNGGANVGNIYHEWGHGLDQNDGGNYDVPTEGYADVVAILQTRDSCVFRGLSLPSLGPCGPSGNACVTSCFGGRDLDWNAHALHTPSTATNWVVPFCELSPGFPAPCGYEQHCEGQLVGETFWDLATRDLPATGMSLASSWQLVDRLWYTSRLGSGGNAYNCALPDTDGCSATSWFAKMRAVDDDDGNLANGTPHAAQIFAAFGRHNLACGAEGDASNQSTPTCPVIPAPTLTGAPRPSANFLSWNSVPNASSYRILRNNIGCQVASTRVSDVTATSFTDTLFGNGFTIYYRVQGLSGNAACDGAVSNCIALTSQPLAGVLTLDASAYACSSAVITVTVVDGNAGASPTASLTSTTEGTAETIPLIPIAPGSTTYRNTITTTTAAPVADGLLSVKNGDTITVTYIDANDGGGGVNMPRVTTATATCVTPGVRPVPDGSFGIVMTASRTDGTGASINLKWDVATCSSTDHHLIYGALETVASASVAGGACNLGTSGTSIWAGAPPGNVWFVIVGDDDATTEGSWGTSSGGVQRGGVTVSGQCGMVARDNSGACP